MQHPSKLQSPSATQLLYIITWPLLTVVVLWVVHYIDIKADLDLYTFGVYPRDWQSLPGILAAPLIHGSLSHLINNSIPLFILMAALLYFYPVKAWRVFLGAWILPGVFAWFIARPSFHIGASGVVYALAAFIFISGIFRGNRYLLALSLLIAFLYGSLFFGMFPMEESIAWESHLGGALTGLLLAISHRKVNPTVLVEDPRPAVLDEEDDIYIAQIGDAWMLQQPEEKQQPPSVSGENQEAVQVRYHITPQTDNRKNLE
jgi:membrane associated rhomboid family serine protease